MNESDNISKELLNVYFDDSSEFLQKAEESLVRLEKIYTEDDINQLFRSAHSLKSSSAAVGFDEVALLTHKLEDLFDCIRKEQLLIDKNIINISFVAFDIVSNVLEIKRNSMDSELPDSIIESMSKIEEDINLLIIIEPVVDHKKIESQSINFDKSSKDNWINSFIIVVAFDKECIEMVPLRRLMLLNAINEIGEIVYSEPKIEKINNLSSEIEEVNYQFIIKTDKSESELHNLLDVGDIEFIEIINVSTDFVISNQNKITSSNVKLIMKCFESITKLSERLFIKAETEIGEELIDEEFFKLIQNEYITSINNMQIDRKSKKSIKVHEDVLNFFNFLGICVEYKIKASNNINMLIQKMYIHINKEIFSLFQNKYIFKIIKLKEKSHFENIIYLLEQTDRNVFKYFLIDISDIEILEAEEIKISLEILNKQADGLKICLINKGIYRRRIYTIFDSIAFDKKIVMFYSEIEAIIGLNLGYRISYLKSQLTCFGKEE